MPLPRGSRPGGHERAVATSERVYRSLLRAYPTGLRGEYGGEMVRCFRDLCREELEDGGGLGLAALWARTLPELFYTALKERSTMLARRPFLPVGPTAAARSGALLAVLGGVLGVALTLVGVALPEEAWLGMGPALNFFSMLIFDLVMLLSMLGLVGLYGALARPLDGPGRLAGAGAALAALAVASWLALSAYGGAKELAAGIGEASYSGRELWLTDALGAAVLLGWWGGLLLLGVAAFRKRVLPGRLRALPLAVVALLVAGFAARVLLGRLGFGLNGHGLDVPALVALSAVSGALPFLGSALLGWAILRSLAIGRLAQAGVAPGYVAEGTGDVGPGAWGVAWRIVGGRTTRRRPKASAAEAAKEKELLEAIRRRGSIGPAGAALETSLSVAEAEDVLSALASEGHIEVRAEGGRLRYYLWEGDG